jgi:hypothetical protein
MKVKYILHLGNEEQAISTAIKNLSNKRKYEKETKKKNKKKKF